MFLKSVLLLFIGLGSIDALYGLYDTCPTPQIENGRVRLRQRSRLVRFTCLPRYTLVGNKYATCRNGHWDVPMPVCVRPSCPLPHLQNGLRMLSYGGAWVMFFCFPKFELIGSPVIYCDGVRWNASAPTCIDTTSEPKLSCDFEEPDLCGWRQDELHDFDWLRINSKTPSSLLLTGPSFDHTLGKGELGYYMYIESTSKIQNETARLISPIYDSRLTVNGCFSLAYHMYGTTIGGLRVYQKPDSVNLRKMIYMGDADRKKYLLFEKWGNLGDFWFNSVSPLNEISEDFQIVIEGIRGDSYTSDIAIDDVAILQGENCTDAAKIATTPSSIPPDSCYSRCTQFSEQPVNDSRCSCSISCLIHENCCPDFMEICIFTPDSTAADTNSSVTSSSEALPQTLHLVAVTTESTTTSPSTSTTTSSSTSTTPSTTPRRFTTTSKPSSTSRTTRKYTTTSTTTLRPTTTSTKRMTTTTKPTTTTIKPSSTTRSTTTTTAKILTVATIPSIRTSSKLTTAPTKVPATSTYRVSEATDKEVIYEKSVEKAEKVHAIEDRKDVHIAATVTPQPSETSTGAKVVIVIVVLVMLTLSAMVVHAGVRSNRVRIALAKFRGRQERDSEVRYLSSDVDD